MKTRILILIAMVATIVMIVGGMFVTSNKKASAEALTGNRVPGFSEITSVPGVSFYINSAFVDKATAITQISDSIGFQKNQYYSYKNGTDKYILFNMDQLIVAAQKGTDFWLEYSSDKEYSLLNTSLMNIWFTKGSKKFSCETDNGMTVTKVCAGVSINSTTYGDFVGELGNISMDGEEWSIFVGVPGIRYDKLSKDAQDGIDGILRTFSFSDGSGIVNQDIYAVSLSGDHEKQAVATEEEIFEYDEHSLNLTNQSSIKDKDEEKAYTSTPYNMLLIGDNGLLSAFNDTTLSYEDAIIHPVNIYRGEEAEKIIMDYCEKTGDYAYFKAPDGQSFEVIEYDLNYKACANDDYVNIKLKGMDGEPLRYRGIKYSARTYDITYMAEEDGDWIRHLYTYYPVPNGCYEYCLECGERLPADSEETGAAYYHITDEEMVHSELEKARENSDSEKTEDGKENKITEDADAPSEEVTEDTGDETSPETSGKEEEAEAAPSSDGNDAE